MALHLRILTSGLELLLLTLTVNFSAEFSTIDLPIDIEDIGYEGTWHEFCDKGEIDKDFNFYPYHELRSLRVLICARKERNEINCSRLSLEPFAAYKYCELMRTWADELLENLLTRLSQKNGKKREVLITSEHPGPSVLENNVCYRESCYKFNETCVDEFNPFFRMFVPLLARACRSYWLKLDQILKDIELSCEDNRMDSDISWDSVIESLNCRE